MGIADHLLSIVVVAPHTGDIPSWLDDLAEESRHPIPSTTLQALHDRLALEIPDALILLGHDDEHFECLRGLREEHRARPAIILCSENAPDERFGNLVDLVIPPRSDPLLSYQIQQAIRQTRQRQALENEIADLKQHQNNHRQAMADVEALKNAVVHNVSHELNTPLLQVKSAVALIAEDVENSTLIDYALRATARLEAAVKNITQLAASLNDLQMSPLLMGDIIDSARRGLRRTWERKEQLDRIQVMIEDKLPPALGDRQGITIVLQQLIDNALKFSQSDVEVKVCRQGDHIQISVRDYGIGIDEAELSRIFDSFYQIDPKSTRKYSGAGVGLANVRLILERHAVEIDVESQKGKGSKFSFELPIANLKR